MLLPPYSTGNHKQVLVVYILVKPDHVYGTDELRNIIRRVGIRTADQLCLVHVGGGILHSESGGGAPMSLLQESRHC